jgi:hypothetical protein
MWHRRVFFTRLIDLFLPWYKQAAIKKVQSDGRGRMWMGSCNILGRGSCANLPGPGTKRVVREGTEHQNQAHWIDTWADACVDMLHSPRVWKRTVAY